MPERPGANALPPPADAEAGGGAVPDIEAEPAEPEVAETLEPEDFGIDDTEGVV